MAETNSEDLFFLSLEELETRLAPLLKLHREDQNTPDETVIYIIKLLDAIRQKSLAPKPKKERAPSKRKKKEPEPELDINSIPLDL